VWCGAACARVCTYVDYDGILFPRDTLLRIRRVLSATKGDRGLIDLHSGNFSQGGPALSYMMFFPFIDSLWFGESFQYDSPADTFLVEISGLPFGLFGDMLGSEHHGIASVGSHAPNLFRGMLFGMTTRYACTTVSTPIWRLWDTFGIEQAEMIGWWDGDDAPVTVTTVNPVAAAHAAADSDAARGAARDDVRVTSYVRHGNATLLVVASWATVNTTVSLHVDWVALGLAGLSEGGATAAHAVAPAMAGVQPHASFSIVGGNLTLPVEAAGGWLLIVS
jgi:hypothetical protein